jgi:hypothetical protein
MERKCGKHVKIFEPTFTRRIIKKMDFISVALLLLV